VHTKQTPKGWPRIPISLYYEDGRAAIDWLSKAFGFEVRLIVEGEAGSIEHSELSIGPQGNEGLIMVGSTTAAKREKYPWMRAPSELGGANTQSLMVYVDDAEAHLARAKQHGAQITHELAVHDYGEEYWTDLSYGCSDLGGHHWWFCQRLRDPKTV